ncbi:hypothetical protein M433DRAFT_22147 [Acidomyces richmondensis BFW]|nr:MAG: hypothetical protein FE78DRAFT_136949 [Acidomyces sp. 'richmondensis']KYG48513.1 hypothetical protein M433DRAFT_22147 [Acidomyces richmondensis BFW]
MATISFSIPILTIPLYYVLAVYPHGHAIFLASKGKPQDYDNRNPKAASLQEAIRKRLSPREYARWERCESCHRNHLENFPLLLACIFAGILAEQRAGEDEMGLNAFCVGWIVLRVLYTANYIVTDTISWSYLRSVLYFLGTGWAFVILCRAAVTLGR